MKKKEQEIATSRSSGAEKVERIQAEQKEQSKRAKRVTSAKGDSAMGDSVSEKVNAKKMNSGVSGSRAEEESKKAKARVEEALRKKEEKEKRKQERAKMKAERTQAMRKQIAEFKEERAKLAEERKALREEKRKERAHKKANRNQAHSRKKAEKNKAQKERESKSKGYGGWIAAVVTLGVTTLALGTTVAVGGMEMSKMKTGMNTAQMGTMYELTGIMEHVDDDLGRARLSDSATQQGRILTDLLVQARLAEADLEKLPIPMEKEQNLTEFVNRTAHTCERLLAKLHRGEKLSEEDKTKLESLYKANHTIRMELDMLSESLTEKDWMAYLKDGEGIVRDVLTRLEEMTLEENRIALEELKDKMEGAGMRRPTSEGENMQVDSTHATRAEELAKGYFSKYAIEEFTCVGETVSKQYTAYNVQGCDEKGNLLFAEIDRESGKLITFDYYEECTDENFNVESAELIAEEFLQGLGYENMTVVRVRENGGISDFTYAYELDGTLFYPDSVHVKVCRTRGLVSGFDGRKYLQNHRGRVEMNAKISMETAQEKLSKKVQVEATKPVVVETARGERVAYEFLCSYEDEYYYIYIDGQTGDEIAIMNAKNIR